MERLAHKSKIFQAHKKSKHRARLRLKDLRTTKRIILSSNKIYISFYIPESFECCVMQNKNENYFIYMESAKYFFCLPVANKCQFVNFDIISRVVTFSQFVASTFERLYLKYTKIVIGMTMKYFFIKIKFRGKGYKLARSKKRRTLVFQFGHAHRIVEYTYRASSRVVMKQALILYGINPFDVAQIARNIKR